jgi:hypothetical protein
MPAGDRRHIEFFGPDLGRGPFASSQLNAAAVQIATALAQLRAPLLRSDTDILAHADFIRQLADRLAPTETGFLSAAVGSEASNVVSTNFRVAVPARTLVRLWLADFFGGGVSANSPTSIAYPVGTLVHSYTTDRHVLAMTDSSGQLTVNVTFTGTRTWYWAVGFRERVTYTDPLSFS